MLTSALRIISTSLRKCSSRKARMRREIMASPTTAILMSPRSASYIMEFSFRGQYCYFVSQVWMILPLHAFRNGNLVLQQNIPVCRRRLHDGEADLQRRQPPATAVQHWLTVHQRIVQLVELRGIGASGL